jgi:hypothetical protein
MPYSMDVPTSAFNWDPSIQGLGAHCRSRHCAEREGPPLFTFRGSACQADSWDKYLPTLRRIDYTHQFPLAFTNHVYNPFQYPAAPVDRTGNNFIANRPTAVYSQPRPPSPMEDLEAKQRRVHIESIRKLVEFHSNTSQGHTSAPRRHLDFASHRAGPGTNTAAPADLLDSERGFLSYSGPHHKHRRQPSPASMGAGPDVPRPTKRRRHPPPSSSAAFATPTAPPADFRSALLRGSASPPAPGRSPEPRDGSPAAGPSDPGGHRRNERRNEGPIPASPPSASPSPLTLTSPAASPVESYATRLLAGRPAPSPLASPPPSGAPADSPTQLQPCTSARRHPEDPAPAGGGGLGETGDDRAAWAAAAPAEEEAPGRWEAISVARLVG